MKRILICDDDDMWLELNSHFLQKEGYEVIVVNSAVDITIVVADAMPDLVVMDYLMPKVNGAEATMALKGDAQCRQIPVILYSSTRDLVEVANECGADAYLLKGVDGKLAELVERMVA